MLGGLLLLAWAGVIGGVLVIRRRRARRATKPRCLALLLSQPRALRVEELRAAAERAYGKTLRGGDDAQEFVTGAGPFVVKVNGYIAIVTVVAKPQVQDPESMARPMVDPAVRAAFGRHRGLITMLVVHAPAQDEGASYAHLGKLVAELLAEDALLLTSPEQNSLVLVRDGLAAQLRSDDLRTGVPEIWSPVALAR